VGVSLSLSPWKEEAPTITNNEVDENFKGWKKKL
jgi:hypothetical protein